MPANMVASHLAPTVETMPPTPTLPQEIPRDNRKSDNFPPQQTRKKERSSFSHQHSTSYDNAKIRYSDPIGSRRMGAFPTASEPRSGLRRHSLQSAQHSGLLHSEAVPQPLEEDEHEASTSESPSQAVPPRSPEAREAAREYLPQPERGRNRKPKRRTPSPPTIETQSSMAPTAQPETPGKEGMQLVHAKSQWEQDAKNMISPTTESTHSGNSPKSDTSSQPREDHDTDRSCSPDHTGSYEEEKAKLEAQIREAQAAQARSSASTTGMPMGMGAGMSMGAPGERLSMGVGGGMPAGGMGYGSIAGGGYPYPLLLPRQMPPGGPQSYMQPPQSPHYQTQAPPFAQVQMSRPQAQYDASGRAIPPTPMSDPQDYINQMPPPLHKRGSSYSGGTPRDGRPGARVPGSNLGIDPGAKERQYGTPEMPRGNANHPHIPPEALTPRPNYNPQVKHLPRGERLPLTGYELLSTQLANRRRRESTSSATSGKRSESETGRQSLPPVYKRFTTMNHRILLTLQDELSELEEQLHRLDTNDTQIRRVPGGQILPASRRQDASTPNELQWTRSNLINRIGEKMGVYNHILTTFQKTQGLAAPAPEDVSAYRDFLNEKMPIADNEARFLDVEWDLITLAPMRQDADVPAAEGRTTSRRSSLASQRPANTLRRKKSVEFQETFSPKMVPVLAMSAAFAVLLPVLLFLIIPEFVGRMTVVLMVAGGVATGLVQAGIVSDVQSMDAMTVAGVYGGVMAVVAALVA